jgi:hypothetical protein
MEISNLKEPIGPYGKQVSKLLRRMQPTAL